MKFRTKVASIAGALVLAMSSTSAYAAALIQGTGFFGAGTATTAGSSPNSQFQFSFSVPDPLDSNPTTSISGFTYTLNGVSIGQVASAIQFYPVSNLGMFDIVFSSFAISIYGADIASDGTFDPGLNGYSVTAAVNQGPATGTGFVTVNASAVPEVATWATMIAGVGLLGGALRLRRQERKAKLNAA